MIRVALPATLTDLVNEKKDENGIPTRNEYLDALSKPEIKSALLVLILNEIRIYKATKNLNQVYDTHASLAKMSAWVDLIDLQAFIEDKEKPAGENYQDELPED